MNIKDWQPRLRIYWVFLVFGSGLQGMYMNKAWRVPYGLCNPTRSFKRMFYHTSVCFRSKKQYTKHVSEIIKGVKGVNRQYELLCLFKAHRYKLRKGYKDLNNNEAMQAGEWAKWLDIYSDGKRMHVEALEKWRKVLDAEYLNFIFDPEKKKTSDPLEYPKKRKEIGLGIVNAVIFQLEKRFENQGLNI